MDLQYNHVQPSGKPSRLTHIVPPAANRTANHERVSSDVQATGYTGGLVLEQKTQLPSLLNSVHLLGSPSHEKGLLYPAIPSAPRMSPHLAGLAGSVPDDVLSDYRDVHRRSSRPNGGCHHYPCIDGVRCASA